MAKDGLHRRGGRRTLGWFSAAIAVAAPTALIVAGPLSADAQADPVAAVGTTPTSVTTPVSSEPSASLGDTVTFTSTVSSSTPIDGGTVTFSVGGQPLCVAAPVSTATTTVSCTDSSLALGAYEVVATYSGDPTFASSASAPLTQIVTPAQSAPAPTTGTPVSGGGITQNQTITTGGSTTIVEPAPTVTVTPHKVAKKTAKPLTLNYLRIVPPHVHWCGTCSYPNATIEFSLSKKAEVRMRLYAPVDGKETLVHTDTLNGHKGANRFRLAGRWRGQLVPKRGVHITFQLLVKGTWVTKKTIPVTVKSRFNKVVPS